MGKYKSYTNSWNDIARDLLNDADFGNQIKSANFAKDEIASLIAGKTDEKQKMLAIYNYVQHNIKWDGIKRYMPSQSLRKAFNDKNGNSAEVNLLLIAMLNEAGIEANPVILSTRNNGIVSPVHASLSDCNYVIASALVNGEPVLLDATEPNRQAGLIPFRCLNGQGRLLKEDNVEEVALTNIKSSSFTMASIELKDGKFTGNIVSKETGLDAFDFRESVKDAGGQKEYFDKIKNKSTDIQYNDYSYTNLDSIYLPIEKKYQVSLQNESEPDAEIIYFNPVLVDRITKNPFTSPTREYPVDYGVTSSQTYLLNLIIPEGYQVEELPQSKAFALPEKSGSFIYKIVQNENGISLSTRLNIDKTVFLPTEYQTLQEFCNLIIGKESEQIVLKKISN
ncbi:MAG TPA: transglutaminase-like domain-containing protein [Prolixibacteraceae bacterium]|nr:transglutaminase-like domain-containing protein [Prolixibacteraceae bacterium]